MNGERIVDDIVTEFFLNTCRLRPRYSKPVAQAIMRCAQIAAEQALDDEETAFIPLTTGSVAEFYIEPMLPHIGDIDVMCYCSTDLAIPRGYPAPTQLPAEFHSHVKILEIIDSDLPGYVYLKLRYLLTECVDEGKYNSVEYEGQGYLPNLSYPDGQSDSIHGPAVVTHQSGSLLSLDIVHCIRCLVWPPQAAGWQTRHRNHDWPDSATVDRVVSNGCDVVRVAHRQYKQREWMGSHQHRLSFSRAEIVLINSWMPVQQIVYHMLRVFMKTERLTESDNIATGLLSNYHIKTLMLWACEGKSRNWWTDDLSLVRICVQLLHIFGDWLTEDARCQHYFINNCNLIDSSFIVTDIRDHLMLIDATYLSKWFVDNYIRSCSELCPDNVSQLFGDVGNSMKLQNAVLSVV